MRQKTKPVAVRPDRRFRARVKEAQERRKQRWVWIVGAVALLAILAFPAYGYYQTYVKPPRVWAAQIGDATITQGDLSKMLRVLDSSSRAMGQPLDLSVAPFETIYTMVENELIRQAAPQFGIRITTEDVEQGLKNRFYPVPGEGENPPQEQLEREYQENFRNFLTQARLTKDEYKQVVILQLYRDSMREELERRAPSVTEQVELIWLRLPSDYASAEELVKDLREGKKDFGEVAKELNQDTYYADNAEKPGYVGWVPRGAFPNLDPHLFPAKEDEQKDASGQQGSQEQKAPEVTPLKAGELSNVVYDGQTPYILKALSGVEVREVANQKLREKLKNERLSQWVREEWTKREVDLNLNSDWYAWQVEQVRKAVPPTQRTPAAGA